MRITERSRRLARAAGRLRWGIWLGVVLTPLLTAAGLLGVWQGGTGPGGAWLDAGGLPLPWASALAIAQGVLVAAALYQLAVLLGQVRADQLFPPQAGRRFGRFALLLLWAVLVHGVLAAMLSAWLVPQGERHVLNLDGADLLSLLVAAVLWLVARFFDAATRLEEDQRSIV
ncbi:MAG TPA: DUF2975 domain-containing protein [Stenotrophomonas sp.]|nr:DUF2975 domain-containing protein [Stenotrophomonas sp.]